MNPLSVPPYTRSLSRQYPGLFIILLDQSSSMSTEIMERGYKTTKAKVVTGHVNRIVQEMIDCAGMEELRPGIRKKNAYLSVVGYDDGVVPLLYSTYKPSAIPYLARNPLGELPEVHDIVDSRTKQVIRQHEEIRKIWVQPRQGVYTNMFAAFKQAAEIIEAWLDPSSVEEIAPGQGMQQPHSESFPPVVINITDGYFNKGGNPRDVVDDLRRMKTNNGNVLVFNCHFTTADQRECIFPRDVSEVRGLDPHGYAEAMFYLSSEMPEPLRPEAQSTMRKPIEPGARCVVYNAKLSTLVKFLRWGTVDISAANVTGTPR